MFSFPSMSDPVVAALPGRDCKAFLLLRGLNSVCPEIWYALFGVLWVGLVSQISDIWLKESSKTHPQTLIFSSAWQIIAIWVCAGSDLFRPETATPSPAELSLSGQGSTAETHIHKRAL